MRRETLDVRPCAVAAAIAFFTSAACLATPVSLEQAKTAAANWFRETSSEETTQSETVLSAFTLSACDGKAAAHIINFAGGGYVIMSAESELSPVLAFSPTGTIEGQGEGALWELVEGSIGRFVDAKRILGALAQVTPSSLRLKGAAAAQQTDDGSASEAEQIIRSAFSKAEAEWAEILPSSRPAPVSGLNLLGAAVPTTDVQSLISQGDGIIYVEPILGNIRWNQSEVGNITDYCYNYYTTNHWPCGCVATAMAQVMRHSHIMTNCRTSSATNADSPSRWSCISG